MERDIHIMQQYNVGTKKKKILHRERIINKK